MEKKKEEEEGRRDSGLLRTPSPDRAARGASKTSGRPGGQRLAQRRCPDPVPSRGPEAVACPGEGAVWTRYGGPPL